MQKGTSGMSQIFGGPSTGLSRQPSKNDPGYPDEEIFSGLKIPTYPFSYLPYNPP